MNFIALHIHNIASIADAVIRFDKEPFSSNPLFLIYGPTGSGKTTILDSICLALYDAAPRLDSLNQKKRQYEDVQSKKGVRNVSDVSNLIRNGSTESFVELTFTGNDGKIYKATWSGKFGLRGTVKGKLLDIDRRLSIVGSEMVWEKKSEVEKMIASPEVVGMSYDNFLRTTILPQGAFNRFLSAGQSEKAEILEKLAGLNRFTEIGERLTAKFKDIGEKKKQIEQEIGKINIGSDQDYEELKSAISGLSAKVIEINTKRKDEQEKINWIDSHSKMMESFSVAEKELTEVSQIVSNPSFLELTEKLKIRSGLKPLRDIQRNISEFSETVRATETELLNLAKERSILCDNLSSYRIELESISVKTLELKLKLTSYSRYKDLIDHEKEVFSLLDSYKQNVENLTKERTSLSAIEKAQSIAYQKVKTACKDYEDAEKKESGLRQENETQTELLNDLRIKPTIVYRNELFAWKSFLEILELRESLRPLEKVHPILLKNYTDADENFKHLELSTLDAAKSLRAKLKVGENCPVCNSRIHELIPDKVFSDILSTAEVPRREAKKLLDENENNQREIRYNIQSLMNTIKSLGIDCSDIESTEKRIREKIESQFGKNINLDKVNSLIKSSDGNLHDCDVINEKLLKINKEISIANQESKVSSLRLTQAKLDLERKSIEVAKQKVAVSNLLLLTDSRKLEIISRFMISPEFKTTDLKQWFSRMLNGYRELENDEKKNHCLIEKYQKTLDLISKCLSKTKSLEEATSTKESVHYEIEDIEGITEELLERYTLVYGKLLSSRNLIENYKRKLEEFISGCSDSCRRYLSDPTLGMSDEAAHKHEDECDGIRRDFNDKTVMYNKAREDLNSSFSRKPKSLPNESISNSEPIRSNIVLLDENLNSINQKIGSLSQQLKEYENRSKQLKDLNERYNEVSSEYDIYSNLNSYFGESHFRDVICEYILAHLLENANIYLRSFSNRYSMFTQPGNLEVMIKDNLTGEERVFSTLSGGETFMASLALALGLASLQNVNNTPDIFFIDEGFGSLSSECLEYVMTTLDNLRKIESRRVGIVSHVESLRDRIPVRLSVRRHGSTSYIVTETD